MNELIYLQDTFNVPIIINMVEKMRTGKCFKTAIPCKGQRKIHPPHTHTVGIDSNQDTFFLEDNLTMCSRHGNYRQA